MYSALKNGNFYGGRAVIAGDIRGEDFINETTNLVTGADVWALNPTGTSQNFVKNMWSQAYYVINLCNLFIDGMAAKGTSVVGTALSNNYVGEARLVRALSYYTMLQFYARPYADGNGNKPGLTTSFNRHQRQWLFGSCQKHSGRSLYADNLQT